jgi:hypothetical protein
MQIEGWLIFGATLFGGRGRKLRLSFSHWFDGRIFLFNFSITSLDLLVIKIVQFQALL